MAMQRTSPPKKMLMARPFFILERSQRYTGRVRRAVTAEIKTEIGYEESSIPHSKEEKIARARDITILYIFGIFFCNLK